jgi:hypothetical protein
VGGTARGGERPARIALRGKPNLRRPRDPNLSAISPTWVLTRSSRGAGGTYSPLCNAQKQSLLRDSFVKAKKVTTALFDYTETSY